MCGDIGPINCGPPLGDRIEKDIKICTEKTGIDFEQFRDFMWKNPNYAVVAFPDMLKCANGKMFDCYLEGSYKDHKVFTINSQTKEIDVCSRASVRAANEVWLAEKEKDEWREKLKSVGLNPSW